MGCALVHKFGQRRRNLVFLWLYLVIVTSSTCAKGRQIPAKLVHEVEDDNVNTESSSSSSSSSTQMSKTENEENVVITRVMRRRILLIGSRPPRCERRCSSCGGEPCKAVQVPIVPSNKKLRVSRGRYHDRHFHFHATITPTLIIAYSRGDDISNYKPMCWKCKCGNFIFNP